MTKNNLKVVNNIKDQDKEKKKSTRCCNQPNRPELWKRFSYEAWPKPSSRH